MITARQKNLLDFIKAFQAERGGVSPRFDQMREHLGLKSKSGITRLLNGLSERGHIRRLKKRRCAIEVIPSVKFAAFIWSDEIKNLVPFNTAEKEIIDLKEKSMRS